MGLGGARVAGRREVAMRWAVSAGVGQVRCSSLGLREAGQVLQEQNPPIPHPTNQKHQTTQTTHNSSGISVRHNYITPRFHSPV